MTSNFFFDLISSITSDMKVSDVFFIDLKYSYTLTFDHDLVFNNFFLNVPLALERMNSLVVFYLEVLYITLFIFFIISLVLLEIILFNFSLECHFKNNILLFHKTVSKKNIFIDHVFLKSYATIKRHYSTPINPISDNYIINIVSFELDSYTIKDITKFNSFSEEEKRVFLFDSFFSIFIKSTNAYNAKCFTVENVYYINDDLFFKFYEVLDFKFNDLIINNIKLSFYSLCIFTNNSINKINEYEFEIKIFFCTFSIRENLTLSDDIVFDINERIVVSEHLDKYLYENKNIFIDQIKNRIIYFKNNSIFNTIT
jgi:hypothetical protein